MSSSSHCFRPSRMGGPLPLGASRSTLGLFLGQSIWVDFLVGPGSIPVVMLNSTTLLLQNSRLNPVKVMDSPLCLCASHSMGLVLSQ